jgi:hypothetical protein
MVTGAADRPEIARAYTMARDELNRRPVRMPVANQLASLYATYLQVDAREPS